MTTNTARLHDHIGVLAALQYDQAQILDGRVTNPAAAATILQAVQTHVRALAACLPRPTPARVQPAAIDPAAMTDAELYAYYRRTAAAEDLRFLLRGRMSDSLRARAEAVTRPAARDLTNLRAAWRTERLVEERAAGIPAIGTVDWNEQYVDIRSADNELPAVDADSDRVEHAQVPA